MAHWVTRDLLDSYYPFYPSMSTTAPTKVTGFFLMADMTYVSYPGLINPNLTWVTHYYYRLWCGYDLPGSSVEFYI